MSPPPVRTFSIHTLGCRVNHYEAEQMAAVLRARGLRQVSVREHADVRVVHTCSVTTEAAAKSRQSVRRATKLPVLQTAAAQCDPTTVDDVVSGEFEPTSAPASGRPRVVVTGCWATSDTPVASAIPGVDAVLGHDANVAAELDRLLADWFAAEDGLTKTAADASAGLDGLPEPQTSSGKNNGWNDQPGANPDGADALGSNESLTELRVKKKNARIFRSGMTSLPLLGDRQSTHQRAFLKIQDGCDAHCTYCIIPQLRPKLWSKPVDETVEEARRLVAAGHRELVLTGIFLGAYGQPTALRRKQGGPTAAPLAQLLTALATRVPGLKRLRVSSLEPGDLTPDLLAVMRDLPAVVPHFHLPLQSGSDAILRRMNRQYTRDDYLRMIDRLRTAYDRPAITTDIITAFPGETDEEFAQTLGVVREAQFIHIHAFPFSPRPNTAAARWTSDFVDHATANSRIRLLRAIATEQSYAFRRTFVGQHVEILVEHPSVSDDETATLPPGRRHGRCERYFPVSIPDTNIQTGDAVTVRIDGVTPDHTLGAVIARGSA